MSARVVAGVVLGASLVLGCAPRTTRMGSTQLTSAESVSAYRESEASADDIRRGRYDEALAHADHASKEAPDEGWARYDRAVALRHLGQIDPATASFRAAEARFAADGNRWAQSVAIYGRARALTDVGRCAEANDAYQQYAALVRSSDPSSARLALVYAADCRPSQPVVEDPAMTEMVTNIMAHDYAAALSAAERTSDASRASGWVDYNRGSALTGLGRTDDAVRAYQSAENRFALVDPGRRGIAVYGRVRALSDAKRCREASAAVDEYVALVQSAAPDDAQMAVAIARDCTLTSGR